MSPQERLSNDEFLTRLSTLLTSTHAQAHGSIYLTQKPLLAAAEPDSASAGAADNPAQILIRATNGVGRPQKSTAASKVSRSKAKSSTAVAAAAADTKPKIRFATLVAVSDLESFYTRYADVCKRGMEGLRKRDKKKAKERAKAKKKGKTGVGA
ncbi:putative signal recognition particle 14kD protein [Cladophialophora carrionii]|uniref:Signal recognition particle subunit SRP14 n=1 Tax=Cladophialophora carrionii TaxID=86049 RepID=A0A1C1CGJ7_9EURO|nr:putative signal recognition particle 14kD protein [Cladophialophora carrionii]